MKLRILNRLYALPLRVHLLMMAFLLSLPSIALIAHSGMTQHAEALKKGSAEARRLTNLIAKEQYNQTGNVELLLTALEQIPEIERHDATAAHEVLASILKKNLQFANIIIADRSGQVWASALPMSKPFSIAERYSFQQVVKTRHFSSGEFTIGTISGKPTIGFGYPIINDRGNFTGVIAANLNFGFLNDLLHLSGLPAGSAVSIVDRNGIIVHRSPEPERYVGTRLRQDLFRRLQDGSEKGTYIDRDITETKRIISYRQMKLADEEAPYLYIRTTFPLEKVMEKAREALLVNIAILSSMLLLAVVSVLLLGNLFFVKRINKLQEAAQRLADGELETGVAHVVAGGELGRLAEVFDEMAGKLAARRDTLVKSERDLFELNQSLTRRVEEETERRVSHERLLARHARLMAMGEMIGAIAHQWRQPLATLGATIQSIRMAWERGCCTESFIRKAEDDAKKQLYYMSDTIEDFRNFFAPDKLVERFDVKDKIAEAITLVAPQCADAGIEVHTMDRAPGSRLLVRGYQNEFKQSLVNLLSNACDAIMDKSAQYAEHAAPEARRGTITVTAAQDNDRIVVEVHDNGCGIDPQHAGQVFDPYFTTKSGDKGTGIGLYMTRLIIEESMAGRIGFTSGPEGTLFRVELARDNSEAEVMHG